MSTAVHFSPHPDDELLGAPGALFALRDAGWRIVNVACSLGRSEQRDRRLRELEEACARAGFELRLDDVSPAGVLADLAPDLVVAPSPHDRHPFHEEVARAVLAAVTRTGSPRTAWLWSLWGDVSLPSLAVELTEARLAEIDHALAAHEGELERTDFRRLLRGRGAANAVAGAERIFGFAAPSLAFEYAELLMELRLVDGRWRLCEPRVLDGADAALDGKPSAVDVTEWLDEPSLSTRFGSRHA
jgi:LmbE family N-acetylglucosaminyl deacetylase